jgi:predicted extracellular nuclease
MRRASQWFLILAISLGLFLPAAVVSPAEAVSVDIVISQVYGGGGNSGATYTHDFIELYNLGGVAVDVNGWSVQYASSTGSSWQKTALSGIIDPGKYYLVQEAQGSGGTVSLPAPNAVGTIAMSGSAGKVALVNNSTTLTGTCPTGLVDFVGYGSATNCSEATPTPNLSNTTAALRNNNGATDTDNNSADFTIGAPNPRNTPPPDAAPFVVSTDPANGAGGVALGSNLTVTFSEPVNVTEPWFDLACSLSDAHAATFSGGPTVFTLDPAVGFVDGDSCTLVVLAASVTDQDTEDPPDNMLADFSTSFSTGDVCLAPYTAIPAIQGSGSAAAITGPVTTKGVVVGDYEGASPTLRGFYLQDLTGDGDAATSDGIFVYNASYNNVNVGDVVRVTGTGSEYQGQTQINTTAAPIACGTGAVEPVDVTFPVTSVDYLERYEGMLVRLSQTLYVTEHYQLGRFGQVVLSSGGRLMQPTNIYAPGPEAAALQDANNLNRIIVDDALNNQNPDPIVFGRGGLPLSASNTLRGGDTATGIVGVMTYTWGGNSASPNAYRVRPINALGGSINFEPTNPRPEAAPALAGSLRVAGMNLLNFFNTFDGLPDKVDNCTTGVGGLPTDCRGADTLVEYNRQLPKTVAAITGTMADVVGLVEVENDGYGPDSALATLVDALNAATAPGTYAFIDADAGTGQINALGTDAIKVGLIYKPAKATPIGTTAALNTVDFVNGGDSEARNRPALAQAFEEVATGGRFVVAVNHLKSKTCPGVGSNADQGDGQGCWNEVRTNAANMLWSWLEGDPTQIGDTDALIIGDLNSYAKEDPIEALKDAGYTDLKLHFGSWEAYSYVFDGQWGYLDHALSSYSLTPQVAGVFDWHINADEPSVLDYNTDFKSASQIVSLYATDEFRMSDHDPVLIDLNLTPEMNDSFVTAGGWIDSPAGAYAADPAATGKAFIPFTLKYKKGALAPTGNLQFQLLGTDLDFRSTSFDWLVINQSGTLAQIQGRGVIGKEAYHFMVWVADGEPDAYRIKIWNDEDILYDNGALQPLGAGSIQIHVK